MFIAFLTESKQLYHKIFLGVGICLSVSVRIPPPCDQSELLLLTCIIIIHNRIHFNALCGFVM